MKQEQSENEGKSFEEMQRAKADQLSAAKRKEKEMEEKMYEQALKQ